MSALPPAATATTWGKEVGVDVRTRELTSIADAAEPNESALTADERRRVGRATARSLAAVGVEGCGEVGGNWAD